MVPEDRRKVINELIVRLVTLDRELPGIPDDRAAHHRVRVLEPDDRRIVPARNVDQRVALAKPVSELADDIIRKDMRPREAPVLLLVVLEGLLAGNHVDRLE